MILPDGFGADGFGADGFGAIKIINGQRSLEVHSNEENETITYFIMLVILDSYHITNADLGVLVVMTFLFQ